MLRSLVGSEMCIRDRSIVIEPSPHPVYGIAMFPVKVPVPPQSVATLIAAGAKAGASVHGIVNVGQVTMPAPAPVTLTVQVVAYALPQLSVPA